MSDNTGAVARAVQATTGDVSTEVCQSPVRQDQQLAGDSKRLWSRLKCLLSPLESTAAVHSADDFAQHFVSKIDRMRQSTAGFEQPCFHQMH